MSILNDPYLIEKIQRCEVSPVDIINEIWEKIEADSEINKIFTITLKDLSINLAKESEIRAISGQRLSLFDGIPVTWKDNFDISGYPTSVGVRDMLKSKNATQHSFLYQKSLEFGLIPIGKTNMTELAFSGLGVNPLLGTPANSIDALKAPGGSSSGSSISVAKGYALFGIGTDTGGSIRTPACWNSQVGIKLTKGVLPTDGIKPLSQYLDSIGFIGNNVSDVKKLTSLFIDTCQQSSNMSCTFTPKILLPTNYFFEGIESRVKKDFDHAIEKIKKSGYEVVTIKIPEVDKLFNIIEKYGNIVNYEGYQNWFKLVEKSPLSISSDILDRFLIGKDIKESDYKHAKNLIEKIRVKFYSYFDKYSLIISPTVPIQPPKVSRLLEDSAYYNKQNMLSLKNTRVANLMDCCSITIPCSSNTTSGLMLISGPFSEAALLSHAQNIEKIMNHE